VIYLTALHSVFGTRPLATGDLALLAAFPVIAWGADGLRRRRFPLSGVRRGEGAVGRVACVGPRRPEPAAGQEA